jgi:branched-chain amino acid aminotransferase
MPFLQLLSFQSTTNAPGVYTPSTSCPSQNIAQFSYNTPAASARLGVSVIHPNVFHNDRLLPLEKARLSPGQVGLICGWGIFTTLRIFHGEAFAFERHWRRLEKDAALTRIPLNYTSAKVRVHLHEVIRANEVSEGAARIYFVYNKIGVWQGSEKQPDVDLIIYTASLPAYRDVIRLSLREHGRDAASPLSGVKSTSWLTNVWAVAEANKQGFDEVVMLNERGEVSECTSANIFMVRDGKIFTPPLSSGCLEGVTRAILMEIAPEAGIPVIEKTLMPDDLYSADEVFISSTNRNLISVGEIAGNKIHAPGEICARLNDLFDAYVKDYVSRRLASTVR